MRAFHLISVIWLIVSLPLILWGLGLLWKYG